MTLLEVDDLSVSFTRKRGLGKPPVVTEAVKGVSFKLQAGEVLGLVGESGCGKTTLSRSILGLQEFQSGSIRFEGSPTTGKPMPLNIQMVFQNPYASLNPRHTIGETLDEPLRVHTQLDHSERMARISNVMDRTGLTIDSLTRFPHEFSGGQRQRIAIARALVLQPSLLIADEPVSALDVSVQAMVLNLLRDLQRELNLAILFISHDLAVIRHMAGRTIVMEKGVFVEQGPTSELMSGPKHPYTQKLLAASPRLPNF